MDNKQLTKIISKIENKWRSIAPKAVDRLYYLLQQGKSIGYSLDVLQKEYPALFVLSDFRNSLVEAAVYGYGIEPSLLTDVATKKIGLALSEAWDASGMTLSKKLHGTSMQMRDTIATTVRNQMRQNATWQEMAKALYDGYLNGDTDVLNQQSISNYMLNVRRATNGDYNAVKAQRIALDNITRLAKNNAPTRHLKAAYMELLEAVQHGTEEQLKKATQVAINEKSRYIAERIARTELARAWADGYWAKVIADDDVVAVKYKLASRHPIFDICDMYAKADMYNLGAGIYPKDKVPQIPVHPHCLCHYIDVYKGEVDTNKCKNKIKREGDKWLKSLTQRQREAVLGVQGAKDWQHGTDWRKNMRGWYGLSNPITRIMGDLFNEAQFYKLPSYGDNGSVEYYADKKVLNYKEVVNSKYNIYVDDTIILKPKMLKELERQISETLKILEIKNVEKLPKIIVVNNNRNTAVFGAYLACNNTLYVNEITLTEKLYKKALLETENPVAGSNTLTTMVHEMIHWRDAQEYIAEYGDISSVVLYNKYIEYLNAKAKDHLYILEKRHYNIYNISTYATKALAENNYDEVFTEYKVKRLLR